MGAHELPLCPSGTAPRHTSCPSAHPALLGRTACSPSPRRKLWDPTAEARPETAEGLSAVVEVLAGSHAAIREACGTWEEVAVATLLHASPFSGVQDLGGLLSQGGVPEEPVSGGARGEGLEGWVVAGIMRAVAWGEPQVRDGGAS